MYIHVYMYTCTNIYIHLHVHLHIHTCTHTNIHTYIYIYKSDLFEVASRRRHHAAGAHQRLGDHSRHLVPKFCKISALLHLLYKVTIMGPLQNLCRIRALFFFYTHAYIPVPYNYFTTLVHYKLGLFSEFVPYPGPPARLSPARNSGKSVPQYMKTISTLGRSLLTMLLGLF